MDVKENSKTISRSIRDKVKMFMYLINDFDIYMKHKTEKDSQLIIDKTQVEIINEITTTTNLQSLIRSQESKHLEDPSGPDNKYKKLQVAVQFNIPDDIHSNEMITRTKRATNPSCFGQKSLQTLRMYYKANNELHKLRSIVINLMKKNISKVFYRMQDKLKDNEEDEEKNFILTHIHDYSEDQGLPVINDKFQKKRYYNNEESKGNRMRNFKIVSNLETKLQGSFISSKTPLNMKGKFEEGRLCEGRIVPTDKIDKIERMYLSMISFDNLKNKLYMSQSIGKSPKKINKKEDERVVIRKEECLKKSDLSIKRKKRLNNREKNNLALNYDYKDLMKTKFKIK